jgi:hypothetical protein
MSPENMPNDKDLNDWTARRRKRRMKPKFLFLFALAIPLVGAVTMLLWNALMPAIFHLPEINLLQALGILLLSKLLFGGFHGGGRRRCGRGPWDRRMLERWEGMTPEERQKFISQMRERNAGAAPAC